MTSGVRRLTLLRAVVPLDIRFALMGINYAVAAHLFPVHSDRQRFVDDFSCGLVAQEWPRRIFQPGGRQQLRPWRIRIAALIKFLDLAAVFGVFGKGCRDMHGRANSHQREKPGRSFAMQADAAVGGGIGMAKSLWEPKGGVDT